MQKKINKFSFKVQKLALTDQNKTKYTITIINQRTHNGFISEYVVRQRDVDQRRTYNLYWYFDTKIPQENSSIHIRVAKIRIRTHSALDVTYSRLFFCRLLLLLSSSLVRYISVRSISQQYDFCLLAASIYALILLMCSISFTNWRRWCHSFKA